MKKIGLIVLTIIGSVVVASAVHRKYETGYVMRSSVVNQTDDETAISYVDGKVVFSRYDDKKFKVYQATVNDTIDLQDTLEMKGLEKLGMVGTVGYDKSNSTLYYSRYESKTDNYMLYRAVREGDDQWSKGERLNIRGIGGYRKDGSTLVNAGWLYRAPGFSGFLNPTLANGGDRIYFTSSFSSGEGGRDIWYIDRLGDNDWSMPQNVGNQINSDRDEDYAFVSGDSLLYFSAKDSLGQFNIWVAGREGDGWGQPTKLDTMYNMKGKDDYNLIGDEKGLFFISSRHEGYGYDIYRPSLPTGEDSPFPWKLFFFDFDRDVFKPEFQADLDSLYHTMLRFADQYDFVVNGHTDSRGSVSYNKKLSLKRAQRIRKMLIEKGIPAEKLKIQGFGFSKPLVPNAQTEEDHAKNRRVEVDIIGLDPEKYKNKDK